MRLRITPLFFRLFTVCVAVAMILMGPRAVAALSASTGTPGGAWMIPIFAIGGAYLANYCFISGRRPVAFVLAAVMILIDLMLLFL